MTFRNSSPKKELPLIDLSPLIESSKTVTRSTSSSLVSVELKDLELSSSDDSKGSQYEEATSSIAFSSSEFATSSSDSSSHQKSPKMRAVEKADKQYVIHVSALSPISRLDDTLLVKILDELPLQQLIIYRVVCLRWRRVIEKTICPKRKSVKLFFSVNCLLQSIGGLYGSDVEARLYCRFECLIVSSGSLILPEQSTINPFYSLLARLIPQMENIVFYYAPANTHDILHMLEKWRRSLTFVAFANMNAELDWKTIWYRIGLLTSLQHLAIKGHWCLKMPEDLPPLKYLNKLSIFNYHLSKLLPVIDKFESSITHLILCNGADCDETALREWVSRKPQLANELTHLTIDDNAGIGESQLKTICTLFRAVTHLDLKFDAEVKFDVIVKHIFELKRLTSLTIRSDNEQLFTGLNPNILLSFDRWFHLNPGDSPGREENLHSFYYPLMRLSSLQSLNFFIRIDARHFCLPTALFPQLRKILINVAGLKCEHSSIICTSCCQEHLQVKLRKKCDFQGTIEFRNKQFIEFLATLQI